jgi:hypothetical protein
LNPSELTTTKGAPIPPTTLTPKPAPRWYWHLLPWAAYMLMLAVCYAAPEPRRPWAIDIHGNELPRSHSEQGNFGLTDTYAAYVTAPDHETALIAAAEAQEMGLGVDWTSSTTFSFSFPYSWFPWFDGYRQRLTTCTIACGCESLVVWLVGSEN